MNKAEQPRQLTSQAGVSKSGKESDDSYARAFQVNPIRCLSADDYELILNAHLHFLDIYRHMYLLTSTFGLSL